MLLLELLFNGIGSLGLNIFAIVFVVRRVHFLTTFLYQHFVTWSFDAPHISLLTACSVCFDNMHSVVSCLVPCCCWHCQFTFCFGILFTHAVMS